jgi:predicted nucleic acid-binding protein
LIVVDANVVAYAVLPGEQTEFSLAALARDSEWVAPPPWQSELRNILATTMRVKRLPFDIAMGAWGHARRLVVDAPSALDTTRVLRLAVESRASAYDCEYVALAEALGVRLVTGDASLARRFQTLAIHLSAFARGG